PLRLRQDHAARPRGTRKGREACDRRPRQPERRSRESAQSRANARACIPVREDAARGSRGRPREAPPDVRGRAGAGPPPARRLLQRRGHLLPAQPLLTEARWRRTNAEGPPLRRVSGPSYESPESGASALVLQPELRG